MASIWSDSIDISGFPPLSHDLNVDILVIGGGMTGALCAYMLHQAGAEYALVEAETVGGGITKNSTAKITSQHGLIYDRLIRRFGMEKAAMYLHANQEALERFARLSAEIPCNFQRKDAFVYAMDSSLKIEREVEALQKLNYPAEFVSELPLPFSVAGAVKFSDQAQFNPLKFLAGITRGLRIYEHTKVRELMPHRAITSNGAITAKKIIMATHFPFINKHGSYFLKLYQHRSYVIALENAPDVSGMYVDEAQNGMSFRNYNGMLLIGGGDHRTGKRGGGWRELDGFAKKHYPAARERFRWATQDCMSLDGVSYIGPYAKSTPGFYVATGYNKWGMTSSMAAAQILTDMVTGRKNPYAEVFLPSRRILTPQLAINGFEAVADLLSISKHRCPHMGCALKWNPEEHTWDCPCHGSRFDERGGLIDNPATDGLKFDLEYE